MVTHYSSIFIIVYLSGHPFSKYIAVYHNNNNNVLQFMETLAFASSMSVICGVM